jgi:hypothetical protein
MTLKMGLPPLLLEPLVISSVQGSPGTFEIQRPFEPVPVAAE